MSQLADIQAAQSSLEVTFSKRMAQLETQLHSGGTSKDTVARISEEFRAFRELMFNMLGLLRRQISECAKMVDIMETRHRCKALVILGVPEEAKEDCSKTLLGIFDQKMCLKGVSTSSIKTCHRIGTPSNERCRPVLVRFNSAEVRATVWKAKTTLRGSGFTVREFLTKPRQIAFSMARQHFGMAACWTQDGTIIVKSADNSRHKIRSQDELEPLIAKYPKTTSPPKPSSRAATKSARKA